MRTMLFAAALLIVATPATAQVGDPVTDTASDRLQWTIDMDLGPSKTVSFETDEGTWMNLDVSPDGATIVFDLMGDVYTMPITGGVATRITSGAAWDFHPRFSPDGAGIAFISDRDGAQNIWLMGPDGSSPRQVSREDNREVNSLAWSPDGEYLFTRKHFVERRSLGAGEVWMYHRSGGGGLQVTERTSWQKDQGEPAVSPDGRWLYYSQDVTPGELFEYNKDPYAGIYAILRRDLETGETERVTGGPGGAITPRLSPDGRLMSFIRRDRLSSVLYLRDLETGQEWPLWDGLERDMQEAWAIHGVYTQYDWLPDGSALAIWAQGGFWRVDAETGEATRIPFTATVEQTIHEGLRYAVDVAPDSWKVRMLRHVTTSPDGRYVAYDALGRIWIKDLRSGGEPRRLTSDDARFELAPAFSPDGRTVAFASWSDEEGGRIRTIGVNGRGAREVVSRRGHYTQPSWSPSGDRIVYRSVGGHSIRGETYGGQTGIFVVDARGGEPRKVRDGSGTPTFDATGERILLNQGSRLVSTNLTGGDAITHLEGDAVTDIAVSPDGEWVAFAERYHAYVARFPRTGRTVSLSGTSSAYPVARISRDAGMYLHWSRDSGFGSRDSGPPAPSDWQVHWTLGPDYFTRDLPSTFAFLQEGGVEGEVELPEPEATGVDIGFTTTTPKPSGTLVLTNARIITMAGQGWRPPGGWQPESESYRPVASGSEGQRGGADGIRSTPAVIENGTLVIEGDRITAVGQAGAVAVPAGAQTIDLSGKTIMPGLIDVHGHVGGESAGILAQTSWPLLANLSFGVTASHDPSNDTETVFANIELVRAGEKLGPRLFSTGTILYGAESNFKAIVEGYDDAAAHLRRMKAVGAFSVKSYNQRRRDARQWIIDAARDLEMMVVPEGGSLFYNNMTMVLDGHTGVEHSLPVPNVYRDVTEIWGASSTGYTPTMVVGYGGLSGEFYWYERTNVWEDEQLLAFTPRGEVDARSRRRIMAAGDDDFNHVLIARAVKDIADAGGLVHLGAHGQMQGLAAHWELWMFEHGGMSPMEALAAGTIMGAQYLGLDGDIGSLEPGKLADLVVLNSNPLDNLLNTTDIDRVMLGGRLYDAMTLRQVAPEEAAAPVMPWQREVR